MKIWQRVGWTTLFVLVGGGIAVGLVMATGFNAAMKATSTQEFCISCHEMERFPWQEARGRVHASNHIGMEVSCSDCHIPRDFVPKMKRKIVAAREVWHHWLGTIDTEEKYESHRREMAEREWARMEANDSAECRACHQVEQLATADHIVQLHRQSRAAGTTCIDCHKGIAHKLPE